MSASTPENSLPLEDKPFLQSRRTGLLVAAVMAMSVCQFIDMTVANVALPHMQTSLNASLDTMSWALTSYIIAGVMVTPLTGWLSDRFGSRRLYIAASFIFLVASALCGAATSLTQMVVFRALQGVGASFLGSMAQTIMYDLNPPSKQAKAMSIWGMVVIIGPITGPFLGGFLTQNWNWRWVFYVNLPIGIPALAILWWLLPSRPIVPRRLDVFGASMLAIGLCAQRLVRIERNCFRICPCSFCILGFLHPQPEREGQAVSCQDDGQFELPDRYGIHAADGHSQCRTLCRHAFAAPADLRL
jgi:MFS transporter, DHA2 family, multidrug resistance protein